MFAHSCFKEYNEKEHVIVFDDDGVISISQLSVKKKRFLDNLKLINAVQRRPALYKKDLKQSVSVVEKLKMWDVVGSELSLEYAGETAKSRWKSLRDQYTRAKASDKPTSFSYYRHI
ncbi:uncharacterized protein LOC117180169 isoform X1 [Belonocnema kinseyi]|uniref:uncharacterized protein LOC117180169 isoform X1 n=1 Tax=Belonocnema kinseyi TaxID=2817044 RepID=UPI00143D20AC|nr:uncharacterized protein LOC117180169 isoform X1 [Belonocnema kinseyi]